MTKNSLARETLKVLLSPFFEEFPAELDIWIEAFNFFKNNDEKVTTARWFSKILKDATKSSERYSNLLDETKELHGGQILGANKINDECETEGKS